VEDDPVSPPTLPAEKDFPEEQSGHNLAVVNNSKRVGKSNLSALNTRLESNLRYILPQVKRNKPSSEILNVIGRALQSPGKMCDPVASPPSSATSSCYSSFAQSPTKEDSVSEKQNEEISTPESSGKIKTFEAYKSFARNMDLGVEYIGSSEHNFQTMSENQELITDFKPDLLERERNGLKYSRHSQVSVLACRSIHENSNSPLGESVTDCKMLSSMNSHNKDKSSGFISKESNKIKTKQINSTPFSPHPRYKPVVLKLLPQKKPSINTLFRSDGGDTALSSSSQAEGTDHEPSVSVQQGSVSKLKQSSCNNAHVDKKTVKLQKTHNSLSVPITDLRDEKHMVPSEDIFCHESYTSMPKLSKAQPFTSIESTVLPVLKAENVNNYLYDHDIPQSVPVEMLRTLQNVTAESSVSGISESSDVVNSTDTSLCNALMEQSDFNTSVGATEPEPLKDGSEIGMNGEQEVSPGMNSMEVRDSCHTPNEQKSGKDCSEITPDSKRKIPLPVTGSETDLSTENSIVLPQVGCKETAIHERKIEERATIVHDKGNLEKSATVTAVDDTEKEVLVSETGSERNRVCESDNTESSTSLPRAVESDPEQTCVQTSLVDKTRNNGVVTVVSEMESKVIFDLGGKENSADVERASEHFGKANRTEVIENSLVVITKNNAMVMIENGDKEKIAFSEAAQMSETLNADTATTNGGIKEATAVDVDDCIRTVRNTEKVAFVLKAGSKETAENSASLPGKECTRLATVKTDTVSEVITPVVPEKVELMSKTRLPSLEIGCKDKDDKQMEKHVLNESPEHTRSETELHFSTIDKSSTAEFVKLTDHNTVVTHPNSLSLISPAHTRGNASNDTELSSVQEQLVSVPCLQLSGHSVAKNDTYPPVETEMEPKSDKQKLSVSLSAEIEIVYDLGPISPYGNKENLPFMSVDTSVPENRTLSGSHGTSKPQPLNESTVTLKNLPAETTLQEQYQGETVISSLGENPTLSGSNVGTSKPQPLNEGTVTLKNLPAETTLQEQYQGETVVSSLGEVSIAETNTLNLCNEHTRLSEASAETLMQPVSIGKVLDSSRCTDLQNQLQGTSNECNTSIMIKAKDIKTSDTESVVDECTSKVVKLMGTAHGIRGRSAKSINDIATAKSRCVPKSKTKSVILKSIKPKAQVQTSGIGGIGAKLRSGKASKDTAPEFNNNCDRSEASIVKASKRMEELDRAPSDHQVLAPGTSVVAKIMSKETLSNIKSGAVHKYFSKSDLRDEPFLCGKSKQTASKGRKCHVLNNILEKLSLAASALLNGEWLILFKMTCMYLKLLIPYTECSCH
jgi:hypothetical protein